MIFSNNERVASLLLIVLLQFAAAKDVTPLAEATCECDTPLAGTVGANRYSCNNGVVGFCAPDEECYRTDTFKFTERGAGSCKTESSAVECTCETPGAGTVGFNKFECTDGTEAHCAATEECYRTTPAEKSLTRDLCRPQRTPRPKCQNGDVRLEQYPQGLINIYRDGDWVPLCGQNFWDNDHGADQVCKQLGYGSGTVLQDRRIFSRDAFHVGLCQPGQELTACDGSQSYRDDCKAGNQIGVVAVCSDPGQTSAQSRECDDDPSDDNKNYGFLVIGQSSEPTKTVDSSALDPRPVLARNVGQHCFDQCQKNGPCNYCGVGKCCRRGLNGGENGCAVNEGGENNHLCVAVEAPLPVECPFAVDRNNRRQVATTVLNGGNIEIRTRESDEKFTVTSDQDKVTARRTDVSGGWDLDLAISCATPKYPVVLEKLEYDVGETIRLALTHDENGGDFRIAVYPTTSVDRAEAPLDSNLWVYGCGSQACDPATVTCAPGQQCTNWITFGPGGGDESGTETWPLSAGDYTVVVLGYTGQTIISRSVEFSVRELFTPLTTPVFANGEGVKADSNDKSCEDLGFYTIETSEDCEHMCQHTYSNFFFQEGSFSYRPGCFVDTSSNGCHWNTNEQATGVNDNAFAFCYRQVGLVEANCFEQNIDYHGNDLESVNTNSARDCQQRCQERAGCNFFSWNPTTKLCFLKNSDAGREVQAPLVSGPKFCGRQAMDGFVDIVIGSSTESMKTVTTTETGFTCPTVVNQDNWATRDVLPDETFEVSVVGSEVTVKRTDADMPWTLNLILRCETAKHNTDRCIKHGRVLGECCGLRNEISCQEGYILQAPFRGDRCDNNLCAHLCTNHPDARAYRCVPQDDDKGWQQPVHRHMSCSGERYYQGQIGLKECMKRCELDPMCRSIFGALEYGDRSCYTCQEYTPRQARLFSNVTDSLTEAKATKPEYYKAWELKREARWAFNSFSIEDKCPRGFEALTQRECELLGRSIISTEEKRHLVIDDNAPKGCTIAKSATDIMAALPRWSNGGEKIDADRRLVCKYKIPTDGLVSYNATDYRVPVVSGGHSNTLLNGVGCVDGNIDTYCRSQPEKTAFLEFELKKPLVVMRVWVANRGDANVNALGRFNLKVNDGTAWHACAERKHVSETSQWTEVYCNEAIFGKAIRIELADHEAALTIADVRVQGIKPADAVRENWTYTKIEDHRACENKAIVKDLSCPVDSTEETCTELAKSECEKYGLNCWGFGITGSEFSLITAIQLYDRRAPKPRECQGSGGLRRHRGWTTYKREHTQLVDKIVYDRPCFRYNVKTGEFEEKVLGCSRGERAFATATKNYVERYSKPCVLKTGEDRISCMQEMAFRQQIGEGHYNIYKNQESETRGFCQTGRRDSRRLEEEILRRWEEEQGALSLVDRLSGRRRMQAQSECRRRAQTNNDNACNNLKRAADLAVDLNRDQVAFQDRETELLRNQRLQHITSGAIGLLGGVFEAVRGIGEGIATGNPIKAVGAVFGLASQATSYGFGIHQFNKEIEFSQEEARLLQVEGDIEAMRDLSDLVQTCDQASTDDLGCELEELGERVDAQFLRIIETSRRNNIEIMRSLARQSQIIDQTAIALNDVASQVERVVDTAKTIATLNAELQIALGDVEVARDIFARHTGPDGANQLAAEVGAQSWCNFIKNFASPGVLDSIARWVVSDPFFELEKPEPKNLPRRQGEENEITRCDLEAYKRRYSNDYSTHVALFDYVATIRKYALGWTNDSGDLISHLRNRMANNYVQRIRQIDETPNVAPRCQGQYPITCAEDEHITHGPNRHPDTRDTNPIEPVTRQPCEKNECSCVNGVGETYNCQSQGAQHCVSCNIGYHLVGTDCVADVPTCANGVRANIHRDEVLRTDAAGVRCPDNGWNDIADMEECRAACQSNGFTHFSARSDNHSPKCWFHGSGRYAGSCHYNVHPNPTGFYEHSLQLCKRPVMGGHDGKEYCAACNTGYHLTMASSGGRSFKQCTENQCPCNQRGAPGPSGGSCPSSIRVGSLGIDQTDRFASQCQSCIGDRDLLTFSAPHELSTSKFCLRKYGFLFYKQDNYRGNANSLPLGGRRVSGGRFETEMLTYWVTARNLVVYPGYCVEFKEWEDGGYRTHFCNCHDTQLQQKRAIGFHIGNFPHGFRYVKRRACPGNPRDAHALDTVPRRWDFFERRVHDVVQQLVIAPNYGRVRSLIATKTEMNLSWEQAMGGLDGEGRLYHGHELYRNYGNPNQ